MNDINILTEINECLIIANQFQFGHNTFSRNVRSYLLYKKISSLYRKVDNFELATYYSSQAETALSRIEDGEYKNKLVQVVSDDFPASVFLQEVTNSTEEVTNSTE